MGFGLRHTWVSVTEDTGDWTVGKVTTNSLSPSTFFVGVKTGLSEMLDENAWN